MKVLNNPENKIRAVFDEKTIRMYQAYRPEIAEEAVRLNKFGSHFSMSRMTWIKPSFLWMMSRAGWASKEGQERILAIDIYRRGFEEILSLAVPASFDKNLYESEEDWKEDIGKTEVVFQWDPEKDIYGSNLKYRSLQIGMRGSVVQSYVNKWIVKITDITDFVKTTKNTIDAKQLDNINLPEEKEYNLFKLK